MKNPIRQFTERRQQLESRFNQTLDGMLAGPQLASAEIHSWTLSTDVAEQVVRQTGDNSLVFITGDFEFHLDHVLRDVFVDDFGRRGRARVLDSHLEGFSVVEWYWDKGISFPIHRHSFQETLVFVTGSWRMVRYPHGKEPRERIVNGGQSMTLAPNEPHAGVCLEDSILLAVSIPGLGH